MSENVGIPTLYKDIQFRSRLEARYAVYFDLLGWEWAYEPIDLPGWIPDFVLFSSSQENVFVEVKPISNFVEFEDRGKVVGALEQSKYSGAPILVLGCRTWKIDSGRLAFGWLGDRTYQSEGYIFVPVYMIKYKYSWGFKTPLIHRLPGQYGGYQWKGYRDYTVFGGEAGEESNDFLSLWAKAGNTVQWKPAK